LWHCINRLTHIVATMHEMNLMPLGVQADMTPDPNAIRLKEVESLLQQEKEKVKADTTSVKDMKTLIQHSMKANQPTDALTEQLKILETAVAAGTQSIKDFENELKTLKQLIDLNKKIASETTKQNNLKSQEDALKLASDKDREMFDQAQSAIKK